MTVKSKLPSPVQAKRIALCWAQDRPFNMMTRGRDGSEVYNDPTSVACLRNGWIAPAGMQFEENGYQWVSHKLTPEGLLALERYLQKIRFDTPPAHSGMGK